MNHHTYNTLIEQYYDATGTYPREDRADFTQWMIDRMLNARVIASRIGIRRDFDQDFGDLYEIMGVVLLVLTLMERERTRVAH